MKTIHYFALLLTAVVGLTSSGCSSAQYGQQRPGYGNQPGYNEPQAGYDNRSGYDDQPGYGNQSGYGNPDFYSDLAPYGQWVQTPEYGNVWIPRAEADFQPYASNGHWIVTEYGNTWVSDYAWGWAPFHYGRWYRDAYRGWAWVPGNDWGPAWVSWRSGGGYYGWAPLGPGINVGGNFNIAPNFWTFVPQAYITSPQLYSYCVPRRQVVNIYQNTTYINNIYRNNNRAYYYGPNRNEIERVTRRSVPVYRIERQDRPGRYDVRDGTVRIYQPDVARNNGRGTYSRPGSANNGRPDNNPTTNGPRGNNPSGAGRGTYSVPFENRPPATPNRGARSGNDRPDANRPGSDRPDTDRRDANPNGSGRGTYSAPFDNRPSTPPTPGDQSGNRQPRYDRPERTAPNGGSRDGTRPELPNRGFNENPSRGSYTPQPDRPVDNTPRPAPPTGRFGQGSGADGGQSPQPQNRGGYRQPGVQEQPRQEQPRQEQPRQEQPRQEQPRQEQPRQEQPRQEQPRQEQPQQAPQGRGSYQPQPRQEAAPQSEPGARQQATPMPTPGTGERPSTGNGRSTRGPR
ncbi:MAG: hypothetical protein H7Z72_22350 [Bacteroidetes bacterium]|nr:hypothetical protein [Fibrella sp.]